jgi:hypothetical protein
MLTCIFLLIAFGPFSSGVQLLVLTPIFGGLPLLSWFFSEKVIIHLSDDKIWFEPTKNLPTPSKRNPIFLGDIQSIKFKTFPSAKTGSPLIHTLELKSERDQLLALRTSAWFSFKSMVVLQSFDKALGEKLRKNNLTYVRL